MLGLFAAMRVTILGGPTAYVWTTKSEFKVMKCIVWVLLMAILEFICFAFKDLSSNSMNESDISPIFVIFVGICLALEMKFILEDEGENNFKTEEYIAGALNIWFAIAYIIFVVFLLILTCFCWICKKELEKDTHVDEDGRRFRYVGIDRHGYDRSGTYIEERYRRREYV